MAVPDSAPRTQTISHRLAGRGLKMADQISRCHVSLHHVCLEEGRPVATLTQAGKFQRQ